eukprot:5686481-Ditylum_brightwellii.AAC.1
MDFSGKVEDWQKWKNCTWCAFDGSGYERVLSDWEYADRMRNQNRHNEDKDGHATWYSLIKFLMVLFSRPRQQTLSGQDWKAISW